MNADDPSTIDEGHLADLLAACDDALAAGGRPEALDPASGQDIELPPGRSLLADLTAARYELVARGVKIEAKDEIKERIGRSPDEGEAVINAFGEASNVVIQGPMIFIGGQRDSTTAIEPDRRLI